MSCRSGLRALHALRCAAAGLLLLASACGDDERAVSTASARMLPAIAEDEAPARTPGAERSVELSLVSYNVHGLPSWLAFDDPPTRMAAIGPLFAHYDIALVQEDWSHHDALVAAAGDVEVRRGSGPRGAVFASLAPFCGHCGSGLSLLSRLAPAKLVAYEAAPLPGCSGWLLGANDCFATKGFLRVRFALAPGIEVDVVDLHLDAGSGTDDQAVRRRQLDALAERLAQSSVGRALVVAGDFNLNLDDPSSREILDAFRARLSLADAGARPTRSRVDGGAWVRLDHVFFRSGTQVRVDAIAAGEAPEFAQDGRPLSDHPAVSVRFRLARE